MNLPAILTNPEVTFIGLRKSLLSNPNQSDSIRALISTDLLFTRYSIRSSAQRAVKLPLAFLLTELRFGPQLTSSVLTASQRRLVVKMRRMVFDIEVIFLQFEAASL